MASSGRLRVEGARGMALALVLSLQEVEMRQANGPTGQSLMRLGRLKPVPPHSGACAVCS